MEKTRLEKYCDRVEKYTLNITIAICAVMLVVAWMHVTRRYVFNSALTWSEEFLRFTIVLYALLWSIGTERPRTRNSSDTWRRREEPGIPWLFLIRADGAVR